MVEVEFISLDNLRFAFPGITGFYISPKKLISGVHSAGRIIHSSEGKKYLDYSLETNFSLKFIEKNHSRICSLHLKDRQASKSSNYVGSDNQIWGQGDTPIKEVLLLMQKNSYDFTATIELEYRIPDGSTPVKEVIKCMDYCKAVLNS